jgi:outer membrane protein assembly factor BamB
VAPARERPYPTAYRAAIIFLLTLSCLALPLRAGDWPEWRGPTRNGVAAESPRLADAWPAEGPPQVWRSEFIPGDERGNLSSPVVADGRVYLYANWRTMEPVAARTVTSEAISGIRGEKAANQASVAKMEKIQGREFADQDALDQWFTANGVTGFMRTLAMKHVPVSKETAHDTLVALDAGTGKTVWKSEFPGRHVGVESSSTPCVAGGRCYFLGSERNVYCVDAKTGDRLWTAQVPRGQNVSSSFLVADGVAAVLSKDLVAFDARSGKLLWTQTAVRGTSNSPSLWRHDGKAYAVVNTEQKVACVDLATGRLAWAVPGMKGANSSPAIVGDRLAITGSDGLAAYRLAPDTAEPLWAVDRCRESSTSPLIVGDHVYVVGNRTFCVKLATGRVAWEAAAKGYIASPLAADGKIVGTNDEEMFMFRASPDAYVSLGRVRLNTLHCASPAFADGRIFVRLEDSVACYDLRAR